MVTPVNNTSKMVTVMRTAHSQGHFTGTQTSRGLENNFPCKAGPASTVCAVAMAGVWRKVTAWKAQQMKLVALYYWLSQRWAAPLTWRREYCLKWQICCRSPSVTGTDWGLHFPCTLLSCTTGHHAHTPPEAGWYLGSSAVTWSWSPSGNHSL